MKRLFTVTKRMEAVFRETGHNRVLEPGQKIFAEYPIVPGNGMVVFEQDNTEFETAESAFLSSTEIANP